MDNVFFDNPPVLQGDERTQLQQLSNYLFTISNKLNEAMMTVTVEEQKVLEGSGTNSAGAGGGSIEEKTKEFDTLKSMIIKTAKIVRNEMDEISTTLRGNFEALSDDFGTLQDTMETTIRATAEGVLQDFTRSEIIQDSITNTTYRKNTSDYIFTGLLDANTNTFGIAVGKGVTAFDQQGNATLNDEAKVATFTATKMSFWQNGTEIAYFSSGRFYIMHGEITNSFKIGNYTWKSFQDGSMVLLGPTEQVS